LGLLEDTATENYKRAMVAMMMKIDLAAVKAAYVGKIP
jgi:hypothetical protein